MHAIITRFWFEMAFDYKPQILDQKIEEFPCLVQKLSLTLTGLQNKRQWSFYHEKYTVIFTLKSIFSVPNFFYSFNYHLSVLEPF